VRGRVSPQLLHAGGTEDSDEEPTLSSTGLILQLVFSQYKGSLVHVLINKTFYLITKDYPLTRLEFVNHWVYKAKALAFAINAIVIYSKT
jgi:hypothetical protein